MTISCMDWWLRRPMQGFRQRSTVQVSAAPTLPRLSFYRDPPASEITLEDFEDLAFARDVLSAGYAKAYVPGAAVEHSNDVTLADYGKRVFDETLGRKRAGSDEQTLSWLGMLARLARDISRTSGRIIRDPDYGLGATVRWLCLNPAYLIKKWINIRRAQLTALSDESRIARYSLEHTLKGN